MARPTTKLLHIEQAAMRLFSSHGISKVTVKEIAKEAGCAEGALYRHYSSKNDLAWSLFSRETSAFGLRLRDILQENTTYEERVHSSVETFYTFFDEDPVTFSFILLTQHDFPEATPLPPTENPIDLIIKFIRDGVNSEHFGISDVKLAASMIYGVVLMPATMQIYGRITGPMRKRTEQVSQACLQVLQANRKREE